MSMLSRLILSTLLFATLAMGDTAWAATYYVDRNLPGRDTNSGTTEETPFLTIVKCVATAIDPGDTCLVKNGVYPEPVIMRHSGTAGSPIRLKNFPGHKPRLIWPDKTNPVNMIALIALGTAPQVIRYIVIEGLELTNSYQGIKGTTAEFITIRNNHIHHNHKSIQCVYCYALTIDRNLIHDIGHITEEPTSGGTKHGNGMYIYGTGHTITNNLIYNTLEYGIQGSGYRFNAAQATLARQAGFQAYIANNTIAYNGTGGIVLTEEQHHDCIIENNLFYENFGGNGHPNGVNSAYGGGGGGHIIRNNFSYSTAPRGLLFVIGSGYTQTNNTCLSGCSDVATNPLFVKAPATMPASPDFHLTRESQAIDFGVNLRSIGITTDITGLPRPQGVAFDVGAYEFSSDTDASSPSAPLNLQVH
jgi:hypothetical protein